MDRYIGSSVFSKQIWLMLCGSELYRHEPVEGFRDNSFISVEGRRNVLKSRRRKVS